LEINTGGMARGYRKRPYPALFLLREWHDMGGRIIITSDSHRADTVIFGYKEAAEIAGAAGFARSTILTLSGQVECELD
jgi:histidinol-phosphatase (PHP family)